MRRTDHGCDLTPEDAAALFADPAWAAAYPPVLTVEQAAALVGVPKQTVYAWSSQGLLRGCSRRVGKHLRVLRSKFIQKVFNEGLHAE